MDNEEPEIAEDRDGKVFDVVALTPEAELVNMVEENFNKAKTARDDDEQRWIKAWRNFRGIYDSNVAFTETEKSRVFIKVTKTKVLAAFGQICEVLFGENKFPITIESTEVPEGVAEYVSFDPADPEGGAPAPAPFGTRDGPANPPGFTAFDMGRLGPLQEKLEPVSGKLKEGPGTTPTAVTFSPAHVAAKRMEKRIHDQLTESDAASHLRACAFEMALLGHGVIKGPERLEKEYAKWDDEGNYTPVIKTVPVSSHVSLWNFYPDPDASSQRDAEWVIERHKLSRSSLGMFKKQSFFMADAIDEVLETGPNYVKQSWEGIVNDGTGDSGDERWEALEFWGAVETKKLREMKVPIPRQLRDEETLNANIWTCDHKVIRLTLNPFRPARIPYHSVPYELNPYSYFGVGVAENMDDTQTLMNGFMRMAVDNAVLSGNLIFEVDESNLSPGQDLEMYPGKVIRRGAGAPGQALFATEYPNVSQQNMMMFDKARMLADESTGYPSYAHGQTNIQGVGRTASGISMFMNAANGNIRTVVKNLDDYLLNPLGESYYAFNMQFAFDPSVKGDMEVKARGTDSLMAGEVRSQRLMQFLQIAVNPMLAPFAKLDQIMRDIAVSLDLDPERTVNSLADAAIQAEMLKSFQQATQAEGGGPQSPLGGTQGGSPPGLGVSPGPGSGGGTIGTGGVPAPGGPGFSANTGEG
jgi:hypothetical protein